MAELVDARDLKSHRLSEIPREFCQTPREITIEHDRTKRDLSNAPPVASEVARTSSIVPENSPKCRTQERARDRRPAPLSHLTVAQTGATSCHCTSYIVFICAGYAAPCGVACNGQWRTTICIGRNLDRHPQCRTGDLADLFVLRPPHSIL